MQYILPGTVLAVAVGPVEHVGIVTDQTQAGFPTVISNSHRAGGVAEEPLPTFTSGGELRIVGYLGKLSPAEVLRRARSAIGTKWKLFNWNCEHFVRWAHGLKPSSPQLAVAVGLALIATAVAVFASKKG